MRKKFNNKKEILFISRFHLIKKFMEKYTNNSLNIKDIQLLNCILCKGAREEWNILGNLLDLIKIIDFITDDRINALAIILENPHLKNLSIANIIIILENINSKMDKLNSKDIPLYPRDNNFFSILKGIAKILNSISDISTEIEGYSLP